MSRPSWRRAMRVLWLLPLTGLVALSYVGLLAFPEPFFPHEARVANVVLRSDAPLDSRAATALLDRVVAKLRRSPMYRPGDTYRAFICQAPWRRQFFFNLSNGAGGVAFVPLGVAFVRDADVAANRLFSPKGEAVPPPRTLDYYLAHELTHVMTGRHTGWGRYFDLPVWVREGVADYVGKADAVPYPEAVAAFKGDSREMDPKRSGLYNRYHLMVTYLLERRRTPLETLLASPPAKEDVEKALKAE